VEFKFAISVEEEQRILREQQEAERAEAERKAKLAEEEAERKEAARKAAEDKKKSSSNSNSGSNSTRNESTPNTGSNAEIRSEIITYAQKFVGNRYVWGGESLTKGADCSGFVRAVYADFGYYIPRVSRDQATSAGKQVSESDMLPGDLVFYANSSGSVNHVAMYIGNGMIVHAANSRQGIIRSNVKYRDIYRVRRIVY
jgi:cell wall-associated NlpC family hydrolase